jgi:hypothetical protein
MRRSIGAILILASATAAAARPASAQSLEAGAGITTVFAGTAASLQVRVNLAHHFSIDFVPLFAFDSHGVDGAYFLQLRHTSGNASGRVQLYERFGGLGAFEIKRVPERRETLATGDTLVYPSHTAHSFELPVAPVAGAGLRIQLIPKVFLETGIDVVFSDDFAQSLVSIGVVLPIGGRRGR